MMKQYAWFDHSWNQLTHLTFYLPIIIPFNPTTSFSPYKLITSKINHAHVHDPWMDG